MISVVRCPITIIVVYDVNLLCKGGSCLDSHVQRRKLTSSGPSTETWKYLALLSSGMASIPGTGSAVKRCVS